MEEKSDKSPQPMLSRSEFERAVDVFLVELHHHCLDASEADLRALPSFAQEIDECVAELRDPDKDAGQLLYCAFTYLDFYRGADWERLISSTYEAFKLAQGHLPEPPEPTP
jgi:hypothetical protein